MNRLALLIALAVFLPASRGIHPGNVILIEDTKDRYVEFREGRAGYVLTRPGHVENRPDLKDLREVHGDLEFICSEIHGIGNPRIVIESKNKQNYQVVYKWGDREALEVIAKPLGLVVAKEEREIQAITMRMSPGGPSLKPAARDKKMFVVILMGVGRSTASPRTSWRGSWKASTDVPVANLTSLDGRWSILLSAKAGKSKPAADEKVQLDSLGLEMRWEKVKLVVTVVKDKTK